MAGGIRPHHLGGELVAVTKLCSEEHGAFLPYEFLNHHYGIPTEIIAQGFLLRWGL